MIRYPILEKDLIAQIKERNKTWLSRAKARTGTYVAAVNTPAVLSSGAR